MQEDSIIMGKKMGSESFFLLLSTGRLAAKEK